MVEIHAKGEWGIRGGQNRGHIGPLSFLRNDLRDRRCFHKTGPWSFLSYFQPILGHFFLFLTLFAHPISVSNWKQT